LGNEGSDLKGVDLKVYRLLLKSTKPVGIREVQRKLNLSSPSLAQYHLIKLERQGLLRKEQGNYTVKKVKLHNQVKIKNALVPKHLFYACVVAIILTFELFLLEEEIGIGDIIAIGSFLSILIVLFLKTVKSFLSGDV
jgi:hypothetical protein